MNGKSAGQWSQKFSLMKKWTGIWSRSTRNTFVDKRILRYCLTIARSSSVLRRPSRMNTLKHLRFMSLERTFSVVWYISIDVRVVHIGLEYLLTKPAAKFIKLRKHEDEWCVKRKSPYPCNLNFPCLQKEVCERYILFWSNVRNSPLATSLFLACHRDTDLLSIERLENLYPAVYLFSWHVSCEEIFRT